MSVKTSAVCRMSACLSVFDAGAVSVVCPSWCTKNRLTSSYNVALLLVSQLMSLSYL